MTRREVDAHVQKIGIVPAIRVFSADEAFFAADELSHAGIPIVEIDTIQAGALRVMAELAKRNPGVIVGAGEVMDLVSARHCLEAGAKFITGPGFDPEVVEYALKQDVTVFPGVLTPSEVMRAAKAGSDFVKVFPCAEVGGPRYIHALKAPFPDVRMIASGGVNQETAADFIRAGADALGIGTALIPRESLHLRQTHRIRELARRFLGIVKTTREELAEKAPAKSS